MEKIGYDYELGAWDQARDLSPGPSPAKEKVEVISLCWKGSRG